MIILGLDISTSITGFTVLERKEDGTEEVLEIGAIDTRNKKKFPDFLEKADEVISQLVQLDGRNTFDEIFIEESLQTFKSGYSSAHVISLLSKFNGIISYACWWTFGIKPKYIMARSARKTCGITIPKGSKAKEVVMEHLLTSDPKFATLVERTRHGNVKTMYYDMADSLIIARAGSSQCSQTS